MALSPLVRTGALAVLLAPAVGHADPILAAGSGISISYGADGLAFDPDLASGIQGYIGSTAAWYDFTYYAGASTTIDPFLASAFRYERDGDTYEYAGYLQGLGASDYAVDWTTTSATDLSGSGVIGAEHVWEMGDLIVTKTETWNDADFALLVHFTVTNSSSSTLEHFTYMHLIDPADSSGSLNSTNTRNDLQDTDSDGVLDYGQAQGRATSSRSNNRTLGLGMCDPGSEEVNFKSGVEVLVSEVESIGLDGDTDGSSSDQQLIYLHDEATIEPGETVLFAFILSVGTNEEDALAAYQLAQPGCWDLDGDGHDSTEFGGDDCDDEDGGVYTGADETWYDGIDSDCGEDDDYDQDADGFADAGHADDYGPTVDPGTGEPIDGTGELDTTDCDDEDDGVNAGVDETWYDGIDSDCGEDDDYDQDKDGYADAEHADDYGPTVNPGTGEDIDGTGELEPTDCDDDDDEVNAGAEDEWYDGVDTDCGENDDYDQDGDGYADADHADDYGPTENPGTGDDIDGTGDLDATDCDDEDDSISPGVEDEWYDGIDSDCGDNDDYDQDGDGHANEDVPYGPTYTDDSLDEQVDGTGELVADDCDDLDAAMVICPLDFIYKGGGGCACTTAPAADERSGLVGLFGAALALIWRRRERKV